LVASAILAQAATPSGVVRSCQHLQGDCYRVGAVVARKGREDRERFVRLTRYQVAGHLHRREVVAGEAPGLDEIGEIRVAPGGDERRPSPHVEGRVALAQLRLDRRKVLLAAGDLHRNKKRT
jgi:hypothetical protein